jgi:hypothetical protein
MLTITIDPVVLATLQQSFPTPRTAAVKALNKYKALLEDLLFRATLRGQTNYERLLNCYSIPVSVLVQKGPHIGYDKVRLHKWLTLNKLDLIETVEKGSNLTGRVSMIKLTELAWLDKPVINDAIAISQVQSATKLSEVHCVERQENSSIFSIVYPDYFQYLDPKSLHRVFDVLPINIPSLEAYISWLCNGATLIPTGKLKSYKKQATDILEVAKHTGGFLPQRKKLSPFGRTYYSWHSVQNVNKELRRAMLGNCWEYDIRSSVVTWKMTFAQELTDALFPTKECRRLFWATTLYLEDRADFMRDVRREMFPSEKVLPVEYQEKLIKNAVIAISFGARAKAVGWLPEEGKWINPAIREIIKNAEQRAKFLNAEIIQQFVKEQGILDNYLAAGMKKELPMLYYGPLITRNVKPSKSKAVAFLYQHAEAQLMQTAIDVLSRHGITPIALIHDAFIVRKKLNVSQLDEIHHALRSSTQNKFWSIKPTELKSYRYNSMN